MIDDINFYNRIDLRFVYDSKLPNKQDLGYPIEQIYKLITNWCCNRYQNIAQFIHRISGEYQNIFILG